MTERPILFSGAMVNAILEGRKTMTRRVVKPQPPEIGSNGGKITGIRESTLGWGFDANYFGDNPRHIGQCPHGKPGDRLWVRETWYSDDMDCQRGPYKESKSAKELLVYRADDERPYEAEQPIWRPSIHMPRWASRITLEITDVRCEQLDRISATDAIAEGMDSCTPYDQFRALWGSINGKKHPWSSNPWVWAIYFRRVEVKR